MSFKEIATAMIKRGVPVIPIPHGEKGPKLPGWPQQATMSLAQVARWNAEDPNQNCGSVAKAEPNGIWILDDDAGDLKARIEKDGVVVPSTFEVKTRKGRHFYFRQTPASIAMGNVKVGGLFDAQVSAKQCVSPGSLHPSGFIYEVANDVEIVPAPDDLIHWVSQFKQVAKHRAKLADGTVEPYMVTEALDAYGWAYFEYAEDRWEIECPWEEEHSEVHARDTTISLIDGIPGFSCLHAHCSGKTWTDFRDAVDPDHSLYRFPIEEPELDPDDPRAPFVWVEDVERQQEAEEKAKEPPKPHEPAPLGPMPESCLYGWLGDKAVTLEVPLGFAYPALLTVFAGQMIPKSMSVRPTMYCCLMGKVHCGKSVAMERAIQSFDFMNPQTVVKDTPSSDRGLFQLFGKKEKKPGKSKKDEVEADAVPVLHSAVLVLDEIRHMFSKISIQGSGQALASVLCKLWSDDEAGSHDKQGSHSVLLRLSMLGGLAIEDATEFSEVFGKETAAGLYDRFIFGVAPRGWTWNYWEPHPVMRFPKSTKITSDAIEMMKQWRAVEPKRRGRLGEIALRVALITASANHDQYVTEDCMRAALEFTTWQESIRAKYKVSVATSQEAQYTEAVLDILGRKNGAWVKWGATMSWHKMYAKAGSPTLNRIKRSLVDEGLLEEEWTEADEDSGKKAKATGRVRLRSKEELENLLF